MDLEDIPQPVLMRASNHAVNALMSGTNDGIRDCIVDAILEERERCAKIADANPHIKGKRIAKAIRGTRRR